MLPTAYVVVSINGGSKKPKTPTCFNPYHGDRPLIFGNFPKPWVANHKTRNPNIFRWIHVYQQGLGLRGVSEQSIQKYLHWALKSVDTTYIGLHGSLEGEWGRREYALPYTIPIFYITAFLYFILTSNPSVRTCVKNI